MEKDMTKGKPLSVILRFTLPLIIGNIFQQLYNMADTIIVGRYVGADALAAVGSTGTIMFLIVGFAQGITAGFSVLTAQRFGALGARVSVAARKFDQLAWAQAMGFDPQPLNHLAGWLCGYDLVVNTIPAPVLTRRELEDLKPGCLILDLASKPGGVDQRAAGELGLTVIWALALPGKVAPVTAGAAIQTAIYNMLQELGR